MKYNNDYQLQITLTLISYSLLGTKEKGVFMTTTIIRRAVDTSLVSRDILNKRLSAFDTIALNDYTLFTNLLTVDYRVNETNKFAQTLLMKSIEKGNLAMIRCLINNDADLHQMDDNLNMALDYATWSNDEDILSILRCRIQYEEMEFARRKKGAKDVR